jgi:2-polyprenyl-3-methyl-5-hydroxy-6-metoxy-1,4-benzoquinol methylase
MKLEDVPCGACGSLNSRQLFKAKDFLYGNAGSWPVAQCESCQVVFLNPRIPPNEIGPYYPKTYYTNAFERNSQLAHVRRTWRQKLKSALLAAEFGYPLPADVAPLDVLISGILGRAWAGSASFSRNIRYKPGGRVMDVGCGSGAMLDRFAALGWQTYGTEVSEESAKVAKAGGHHISMGALTDLRFAAESFDVVTLWDTLEHIHNPLEIMTEACRLCKTGGEIYVYVPNFGSLYASLLRDHWFMFTAPLHYYHYTSKTLRRLAVRAGFNIVSIEFPYGDAGIGSSTLPHIEKSISSVANSLMLSGVIGAVDKIAPNGHLLLRGVKRGRA